MVYLIKLNLKSKFKPHIAFKKTQFKYDTTGLKKKSELR